MERGRKRVENTYVHHTQKYTHACIRAKHILHTQHTFPSRLYDPRGVRISFEVFHKEVVVGRHHVSYRNKGCQRKRKGEGEMGGSS